MGKNIIKLHLSNFLNEDKKPVGLKTTEKVQADSKKANKEYQKEVSKKMSDYDKAAKTDEKKNADSVKKYENDKTQEEYHDDYEILNGQEMLKYDNEPSDSFKERAIKAIEGDASMGNGPGANAEATWGASSDTFGKDLVKRVKARVKKDADTMQYDGMGDVAIPRGKNKHNKSVAVAESTENKLQVKTNKMKRLKFKNAFNGVGNALQLIPENYKVDNKTFQMTDGNENYEIRWEGTVNEGKAVILKAEDKTMISENMKHMKHLMGYKSQDTLGTVKGAARLDENSAFSDVFNKTKALLEGNVAKDIIIENATGVAGMGFEAADKPNPTEVKPGTESGHAKAEGPMVMKEEGDDEEECDVEVNETMDRFDEVFSGLEEEVNETLTDKQSEEMDTDKDGDIDGKDLANLRK